VICRVVCVFCSMSSIEVFLVLIVWMMFMIWVIMRLSIVLWIGVGDILNCVVRVGVE